MLFSYNWLQTFFEKKLPKPEVLADLIMRRSFEVEGLVKKGGDAVLDVAVLSNRPDCLSHIGMAREIAAALDHKANFPKIKKDAPKKAPTTRSRVSVEVKNNNQCRRYCAKMVQDVKVGPSPKWMQERLVACGLRPINNVVDSTNYVMLETGQPLHAFDWDKLDKGTSKAKAKKIVVRTAQKGEKMETLDDKICALDPSMLVIADSARPLAIAGIKGGKTAEISAKTRTIIIEAANFNQKAIRQASRRLGLVTDASVRFAHGLDPNEAEPAANRCANIICEIANAQPLAGMADAYPRKVMPKRILLNSEAGESLLGRAMPTAQTKKILEALGFSVRKASGASLDVLVPTRRSDVGAWQDLVEEVGRITGYEELEPKMPCVIVLPAKTNYFWKWKNIAKDALVQAGYFETRNYTFICEKDIKVFDVSQKSLLEVKNPVNIDLRYLRPSLLVNLLKNAANNLPEAVLRQFEIGKIFGASLRMEPTMVAGFSTKDSFFEMKGSLEFLCHRLGIMEFSAAPLAPGVNSLFETEQSARVIANKKEIGIFGRISKKVAESLDIAPVFAFELSMDVLALIATEKIIYRPISTHPQAVRDIAVVTPRNVYCQTIIDVIKSAAGPLLVAVQPFDIYEGAGIAKGAKNIAFHLAYQSGERTLAGKEVDELQARVIKALEERGWQVRK
jgi:phenylalanyl-tRNA synthetase beta chain